MPAIVPPSTHTHIEAGKGHPLLGDTVFYPVPRDAQAVCEILAATTHAMDAVCHAAKCHTAAEGPYTHTGTGGDWGHVAASPPTPVPRLCPQDPRAHGWRGAAPPAPAPTPPLLLGPASLPGRAHPPRAAPWSCPRSCPPRLGRAHPPWGQHRRARASIPDQRSLLGLNPVELGGCSRQPASSTGSSTQTPDLHPG